MHDTPAPPELLLPGPGARSHRRSRDSQRIQEAGAHLRTDRTAPVRELLHRYRRAPEPGLSPSPLGQYRERVESEVLTLEAVADERSRKDQTSGPTIRLALLFLKSFGRLSSLDFSEVPIEERPELVSLLALEYRWCLAAAGTTHRSFKRAIGRTGAR